LVLHDPVSAATLRHGNASKLDDVHRITSVAFVDDVLTCLEGPHSAPLGHFHERFNVQQILENEQMLQLVQNLFLHGARAVNRLNLRNLRPEARDLEPGKLSKLAF
jgi:hypothetical protein